MAIYVSDENGKLTKYAGGSIDRIKANKDASNLSDKDVADWKVKLGVLSENLFFAYPLRQSIMDIYVDCTDGNKFTISGDDDTGIFLSVKFPIEPIPAGTYNISAFGLESLNASYQIYVRFLNKNTELIYGGIYYGSNNSVPTVTNIKFSEEVKYVEFLFNGGTAEQISGEVTMVVTNSNISPTIDMIPAGRILTSGEMFGIEKIETGVTNRKYGIRSVIESYLSSDGNTWYRIYSDGWKECGGKASGSGTFTITLPVEFTTTTYSVNTTFIALGSATLTLAVSSRSTSQITFKKIYNGGNAGEDAMYTACGY